MVWRGRLIAATLALLVLAAPALPQGSDPDVPPPFVSVKPLNLGEGKQYNGEVARFLPETTLSCYSATIDWGDGTPTSAGGFTDEGDEGVVVRGVHTYRDPGAFRFSVLLDRTCPTSESVTARGDANITDALKTAKDQSTITVAQGETFTGKVGGFSDADPTATVDDYSGATVSPGDGRPPVGAHVVADGSDFAVRVTLSWPTVGTFAGSGTVNDALGDPVTFTYTVNVTPAPPPPAPPPPPPVPVPNPVLATAVASNGPPHVKLFSLPTLTLLRSFYAFESSFTGGVRVALGDVSGDGRPDVITGAGPGGGPYVRVFDGVSGAVIGSFLAYPSSFTGGVFVAAGDMTGDGRADIIIGPGGGGAQPVKVFDAATLTAIKSFLPYGAFARPVTVAAGYVNADGRADIITGAGAPAPGGHVKVFSGADLAQLGSFFALPAGFTGGVNVAAGDVNADGRDDIVTGPAGGGGPRVKVFDATSFAEIRGFLAFDPGLTGGVSVAAGIRVQNLVADATDIVAGAYSPAPGGHVRVFDGATGAQLANLFSYASSFRGGVNVASSGGAAPVPPAVTGSQGIFAFGLPGGLIVRDTRGKRLLRLGRPRSRGTAWIPLVGDWDGDGTNDVGVHHDGAVSLYTLTPRVRRVRRFAAAAGGITTGDFDGNGRTDIAVLRPSSRGGGTLHIRVMHFRPSPTHLAVTSSVIDTQISGSTVFSDSSSVGTWNVDRDSTPEIALAGYEPDGDVRVIVIEPRRRPGLLRFAQLSDVHSLSPLHLAAGDFNGDGRHDLAVSNARNLWIIDGRTRRANRPPSLQGVRNLRIEAGPPTADGRATLVVVGRRPGRSSGGTIELLNYTGKVIHKFALKRPAGALVDASITAY